MIGSERNLTIREIEDGEEFVAWLADLVSDFPSRRGQDLSTEQRHLALTNEIGDWVGGLHYTLRGGVATLAEMGVIPSERGRGHAFRLLTAFEEHARGQDAHLVELWSPDLRAEPLLSALGWRKVLTRHEYFNGQTWHLLDKPLR